MSDAYTVPPENGSGIRIRTKKTLNRDVCEVAVECVLLYSSRILKRRVERAGFPSQTHKKLSLRQVVEVVVSFSWDAADRFLNTVRYGIKYRTCFKGYVLL